LEGDGRVGGFERWRGFWVGGKGCGIRGARCGKWGMSEGEYFGMRVLYNYIE